MDNNGWIKLHTKILQWEWYDDRNTFSVFLHLLLTANWQTGRWHGIEIKRGQRITSLSKLAKELKLSTQNVRTALLHLKSTGEITNESQSNSRIITIKKYDDYQGTNIVINKRPTNDQQTTNNNIRKKEYKKERYTDNKTFNNSGANAPTPEDNMMDFIENVTKRTDKATRLVYKISDRYKLSVEKVAAELDKFVSYWCEKTRDGKRERWQLGKTFEVQKRLATWFQKMQNYSTLNHKGPTIIR